MIYRFLVIIFNPIKHIIVLDVCFNAYFVFISIISHIFMPHIFVPLIIIPVSRTCDRIIIFIWCLLIYILWFIWSKIGEVLQILFISHIIIFVFFVCSHPITCLHSPRKNSIVLLMRFLLWIYRFTDSELIFCFIN